MGGGGSSGVDPPSRSSPGHHQTARRIGSEKQEIPPHKFVDALFVYLCVFLYF